MKKRLVIVLGLVLVLLVGITSTASAIVWGEPDAGEHPYVGLVISPAPSGGYYICSGTLIAPDLFLTAAHCVDGLTDFFVTFKEAGPYSLANDFTHGSGYAHPNYDGLTLPATYDVGVVVLDQPVVMDEYGVVAPLGFLDEFATAIGTKDPFFTSVGYGINAVLPNPMDEDVFLLARYKSEQRLNNLKNALIDGYNVQFTNNPGLGNGSGGTCSGDSGGPLFYGDTNMVAAINSFGIAPHCNGNDYAFRADTAAVHDFLAGFGYFLP
ncbi:trypsin-like serine protease [bacterium]|nr:trypsin-like serine protease [bacterium]MCB2178968.1 trypsin-like serine protease [bacterium]